MQLELKRIQREWAYLLYVTHDQDEAMALGDRIAVMHGGKYEDLGAPSASTTNRRRSSWRNSWARAISWR